MGTKTSKTLAKEEKSLEEVITDCKKSYVENVKKAFEYIENECLRKGKFVRSFAWEGTLFKIPKGCEEDFLKRLKIHLENLGFENVETLNVLGGFTFKVHITMSDKEWEAQEMHIAEKERTLSI